MLTHRMLVTGCCRPALKSLLNRWIESAQLRDKILGRGLIRWRTASLHRPLTKRCTISAAQQRTLLSLTRGGPVRTPSLWLGGASSKARADCSRRWTPPRSAAECGLSRRIHLAINLVAADRPGRRSHKRSATPARLRFASPGMECICASSLMSVRHRVPPLGSLCAGEVVAVAHAVHAAASVVSRRPHPRLRHPG